MTRGETLNATVSIDYEGIHSSTGQVCKQKTKQIPGQNKQYKKLCTGITITDLFGKNM